MNTYARTTIYKLPLRSCQRFVNAQSSCKKKVQWLKPAGYETNITVYNPIAKCKVPFIVRNKKYLTWYVCGPTVYDSAHIGHAVTYVKTDIIRRILSDYFNMNVIIAMGITDIDDKIINRANVMNVDYKTITQTYEDEFRRDLKALGILEPNLYCRVTEYIPEIIMFIENIMQKGYAYVGKDGSVYFHTTKYDKYGKLSTSFTDEPHENKKSTLDFSLWKASKPGEPYWESPWGRGRPGWHTECSAIASTIFGPCIDVHSGGIDLAFPHHENEEAQSCCFHEVGQWINYWLHCGHLNLQDVKMSKSLKNTISINEFLQTYTSNEFRMLCLLSNYRNGIEFTNEVMQPATSLLNKLKNFLVDCRYYVAGTYNNCNVDEVALFECLHETKSLVNTSFSNDFNTAEALKSIIKLVDVTNTMLHSSGKLANVTNNRNIVPIAIISDYISNILSKLGISVNTVSTDWATDKVNNIIEEFVQFRNTVRQESLSMDKKNVVLLSACDQARMELSKHGIVVKDGKNCSVWYIKS